jgi:hypothetical protein
VKSSKHFSTDFQNLSKKDRTNQITVVKTIFLLLRFFKDFSKLPNFGYEGYEAHQVGPKSSYLALLVYAKVETKFSVLKKHRKCRGNLDPSIFL